MAEGMLLGHVRHFMGDDTEQFLRTLDQLQQAGKNDNVTARQRERIHWLIANAVFQPYFAP
jgi:hypothetical protein